MNTRQKTTLRLILTLSLASLSFGDPSLDTLRITVELKGDIFAKMPGRIQHKFRAYSIAGTPYDNTLNGVYEIGTFWQVPWCFTGYVKAILPCRGFKITPLDTFIYVMLHSITIPFTVKDTLKPVVRIRYFKDTAIPVNKLFTFIDSIDENSEHVKSIYLDCSIDSGKTWDSVNHINYSTPDYLLTFHDYSSFFSSCPISFTPTVVSNNYILRVITTDVFNNVDTSFVTLKVKPIVEIYKNFQVPRQNRATANSIYDLSGKKVKYSKRTMVYINHKKTLTKIH